MSDKDYTSAKSPDLTDETSDAGGDEPNGSYPNPTEDAFYEAEESRSDPREFEHIGQVEVQLEGMYEPVRVDELTLDDLNSTNYPKDEMVVEDFDEISFDFGTELSTDSVETTNDAEVDTLMMAKAVDVSDVEPSVDGSIDSPSTEGEEVDGTQQQMYREMARLFEEQFELFINKNRDYGSSFETGGEVEQLLGDGPFDDAETANLYKLFTRIGDKRQRFFTQAFCNGDDNVNESLHETATDAAVYWMMVGYLTQE